MSEPSQPAAASPAGSSATHHFYLQAGLNAGGNARMVYSDLAPSYNVNSFELHAGYQFVSEWANITATAFGGISLFSTLNPQVSGSSREFQSTDVGAALSAHLHPATPYLGIGGSALIGQHIYGGTADVGAPLAYEFSGEEKAPYFALEPSLKVYLDKFDFTLGWRFSDILKPVFVDAPDGQGPKSLITPDPLKTFTLKAAYSF